jgi:hypothetical protein
MFLAPSLLATIRKFGSCEDSSFQGVNTKTAQLYISETPSEKDANTTSKPVFEPHTYNTTSDDNIISGFAGVREQLHFSANLGFSHD